MFEARFKKRLYPEGYTFDEVKAYCDDLGDGYQVPVPKNLHQNKALMELYSQGEHKLCLKFDRYIFLTKLNLTKEIRRSVH